LLDGGKISEIKHGTDVLKNDLVGRFV